MVGGESSARRRGGGAGAGELFVKKGADVNAVGKLGDNECTPLCWAAQAVKDDHDDARALVRLLLSNGATLAAKEKAE